MIVEHHIKYKEIDGKDETIFIEKGEHKKIHNKLGIKIPKAIINAAHQRTEKFRGRYNRNIIQFREYIEDCIFYERIRYNPSGSVEYFSGFYGNHGKKLPWM